MFTLSGPRMGVRKVYAFTQNWRYTDSDNPTYAHTATSVEAWSTVHLPHANVTLPHKDFSPNETRFVSWYRKTFAVPVDASNKRVTLFFDGVMTVAQVYVNGTFVGEHQGGFTPFSFDITHLLHHDEQANVVAVRVDSTRRTDVPPEGHIVDYLVFGGIYRNVYLVVHDAVTLKDVYLQTVTIDGAHAEMKASIMVQNKTNGPLDVTCRLTLISPSGHSTVVQHPIQLHDELTISTVSFAVDQAEVWSIDSPNLYNVYVECLNSDGIPLDDDTFRFGIRTMSMANDGLVLNGIKIKLRGLNRHQTFPYIGGAAPARLQQLDAQILKRNLGLNFVRTSHYPQDPSFLDACDELGLLVFTELPGWQHIGDAAWKSVAQTHLREMILRDRNRACIFMWGTRINESPDDHDFYTTNLTISKSLDSTRFIGGVRNFRGSEYLEDVFTLNDFSMGVMPTTHTPQLITEFLGHMYPTKTTDPETRLAKHAAYHAHIVDEVYGRDDIVGSSGWCAFDYNTNESFGPGDMICYHGVMDIFRLPKFAAHFYASQQSPATRVILEPATYFTFATAEHAELIETIDLTHMEAQTHSEKYLAPIYIFSNCDEIAVCINGDVRARLTPCTELFPALPHPPFCLRIQGYGIYGTMELVGYIEGKEVTRRTVQTPMGVQALAIDVAHHVLVADGSDMTRVAVRAVDQHGTQCPFANRVVTFEVEGPGELVGENPIALEGGQIAVFAKSGCTPGTLRVTAKSAGLPPVSTTIEVVAAPNVFL